MILFQIEGVLTSLKEELENELGPAEEYLRNGKEFLNKMHEDFHEKFNKHVNSISELADSITENK